MQQSNTIGELVKALTKAQLEMENPTFDSINPHFQNRFASLAAHTEAIRKPFARVGLAVIQGLESDERGVCVTTKIVHTSGEWIESAVCMPLPEKATAQHLGSICTYLRRYSLASSCFIVGESDEDGEADRKVDRNGKERPSFNPSKAVGGINPTKVVEDVVGEKVELEIFEHLSSILREGGIYDGGYPSGLALPHIRLIEAISSSGVDTSGGLKSLPISTLPRIERWINQYLKPEAQISLKPIAETVGRLASIQARKKK